jgi:hypothetical protein
VRRQPIGHRRDPLGRRRHQISQFARAQITTCPITCELIVELKLL